MVRPKVLLVGSSIFQDWGHGPQDVFRSADVINAAVGGSETIDWLPRIGKVLHQHRPDVLCVYCGSNDLSRGRSPEDVAANLALWRERVEAYDAEIAFVYFSIIKGPEKAARFSDIDAVHGSIHDHARPGDRFIDLNPVFVCPASGESMSPSHPEGLFVADGVHLTAEGYTRMAERTCVELADTNWV